MENDIKSIKDERVVLARDLHSSKMRVFHKKFLILGQEAIVWALSGSCNIEYIFIHDRCRKDPFLEKILNIPHYFVSDGILKKISDTTYLIPFVAVASYPKESFLKEEIVVVFDSVKDFGNVGTIVRTAKAFGIREFVSTESDFDFFYKKTIDASRGAVFSSFLQRFSSATEAVRSLKNAGYQIVVTTLQDSQNLSFSKIGKRPIAIVFGNETMGVSKEMTDLADLRIHIPMSGDMESLNVGVAAGISLYEMKTKVILSMLTEKIKSSFGNIFYVVSRYNRLVFDKKLKESTPFDANQAIAMMIVYVDGKIDKEKLLHDAGIMDVSSDDLLHFLIEEKYLLLEEKKWVSLTEKGKESLAKIWLIGELCDKFIFEGFSDEEKEKLKFFLERICKNCGKIANFS
ncbi:MAG: RNA methyltransferase [Chlamydiota bacterium]